MARRYVRDNRGRFASKGAGATARGGRLKTAGGKKRATQTMKASGAKPAGAIKGKVKRDPAAASRVGRSGATKPRARRPDQAEVNIKGRFTGQAGKRFDASIDRAVKQAEAAQTAALMKPKAQVRAERAAAAEAKRQAAAAKPKRTRTPESLRMSRAKQIKKRRSITTNPAGERASSAAKMAANAARTQERATAFLKAGGKTKPTAAAKPVRRNTKLGFAESDFARRSQRTASIRNPEVKAKAQRLYGRVMDTGQTPRQLRSMFKKAGKPKAKNATAAARRMQREHRDMMAASRILFK